MPVPLPNVLKLVLMGRTAVRAEAWARAAGATPHAEAAAPREARHRPRKGIVPKETAASSACRVRPLRGLTLESRRDTENEGVAARTSVRRPTTPSRALLGSGLFVGVAVFAANGLNALFQIALARVLSPAECSSRWS